MIASDQILLPYVNILDSSVGHLDYANVLSLVELHEIFDEEYIFTFKITLKVLAKPN